MTTADTTKIRAEAKALYDLYQMFGRGRITEEKFVLMYIEGKLLQFIKKVVEGEKVNE